MKNLETVTAKRQDNSGKFETVILDFNGEEYELFIRFDGDFDEDGEQMYSNCTFYDNEEDAYKAFDEIINSYAE